MKKDLKSKLKDINSVLDTRYLVQENENLEVIKNYYKTNKITYRLFHNWSGFLHMGISRDSKYRKNDLLEQAREIDRYVKSLNAKNILELGAGRGANSFYLSKNNPSVACYAIDLSTPPIKKYVKENLIFKFANYHNLSLYQDNFFDIIFAIETVCHSNNKEVVLSEVYKRLRKGGILIIYDGYLKNNRNLLNKEQKNACILIEKGMAVNEFETLQSFNKKITDSGFTILQEENLSQNILPTLYKFEKLAKIFFENKLLQKLVTLIFPEKVIRNSLSGYLMPDFIKEEIGLYIKHVLQK